MSQRNVRINDRITWTSRGKGIVEEFLIVSKNGVEFLIEMSICGSNEVSRSRHVESPTCLINGEANKDSSDASLNQVPRPKYMTFK